MSDTLFGSEKSGTPIETRDATGTLADQLDDFLQGRGPNPFDRAGRSSVQSLFGFDPAASGVGDAVSGTLADPADRVAGLFASMRPFEERETERQVSGLRSGFGTLGGRFGRNVMQGEGNLRGQLSAEFGRNREQALLQANQQRIAALSAILQGVGGTAASSNQALVNFLNPGAPNWQEGIMGDIITAAATAAAAAGGG